MIVGGKVKLLDIDMDYFLFDVPSFIPSDCKKRIDGEYYKPWSRGEVISFLENNLGLSKSKKIQGQIVTHHHEALYYWRDLINKSRLNVPFEVVHVDSHADLGLGFSSWVFIFEKLLGLEVEMRANTENYSDIFSKYKLPDIGDYLLYALAFRWISKLTYVCNPTECGNDYLLYILKDCIEPNDKIQLPYNNQYPAVDLNYPHKRSRYLSTAILEPEVPFEIIHKIENVSYKGDYDFITFCISPNYTPKKADFIIDVIKEYIIE